MTSPITSSTRRLQGAPYALALASGEPLLVLRLTSEFLTLAIGVLAALLAASALRLPAAGAFAAGALTITATSDWLTASFVATGYHLAIALYLAGTLALVWWARGGPLLVAHRGRRVRHGQSLDGRRRDGRLSVHPAPR